MFIKFIQFIFLLPVLVHAAQHVASSSSTPPTFCTELAPCKVTLKKDVLTLSWHFQVNEEKIKIHFDLTLTIDKPSETWLAFGARSPSSTGNKMTGPPASIAAIGNFANGIGKVHQITLNTMSYPPETGVMQLAGSVVNIQGNTLNMMFSLSSFGEYSVAHDSKNVKIPLLYAIGSLGADGLPQRHYYREGIELLLWRKSGATAEELVGPMFDSVTLRLYHGAALSFIWGFCTIVGASFARYCRHKWYWFTAHKTFQSLGGLFTLPLTFLAYFSKDAEQKHYTWMHGSLGFFLGVASSVQGLLGSITHRSHRHWCGVVFPPSVDHLLRMIHRTLGKVLLFVAFLQIGLGIEKFSPNAIIEGTWIFGPIFLGYSSILWATIIALELSPFGPWNYCRCRHKENINTEYNPVKGTGFMHLKDLQTDREMYQNLQTLAAKVLSTFVIVTTAGEEKESSSGKTTAPCPVCEDSNGKCRRTVESCLVNQWWNRNPGKIFRRCTTFWLPHWIKYLRLTKSMSTKLLFHFVEWVLNHSKMKAVAGNGGGCRNVEHEKVVDELRHQLDQLKANLNISNRLYGNRKVKPLEQENKEQSSPPPPPPEEDEDNDDVDFDAWGEGDSTFCI